MGAGDIGLPSFQALATADDFRLTALITQPDKPAGRGLKERPPAVKTAALEIGLPVCQPTRLRGEEGERLLREILGDQRPDFVVVIAFGQILPRTWLDLPRVACVNVHTSLLPRHRGAAPIHSAILAGETTTGVSIMHMTEELDAGDVITTFPVQIARRETAGSLHDRLALLAPAVLLQALRDLRSGAASRTSQDHSKATFAGKLTRETGRIDWARSAEEIDRLIRGVSPWPGAWTTFTADEKPRRLKVHGALRLSEARVSAAVPGEILGISKRGIIVAASSGATVLREVQEEGRSRMTAWDFANGRRLRAGFRFTAQ